ncbi:MAG: MoaD/ThiS family protein [Proteobacteria bacterium]|nr:MoaD/ThiS family protein [Pseudomonadota bacterium]
MKTIHIQYFAVLRELAGRSQESVPTDAETAAQLYAELVERYGFSLGPEQIRVVVNDAFDEFSAILRDGDEVVFLPPLAGG